jgi:hypothetical protein
MEPHTDVGGMDDEQGGEESNGTGDREESEHASEPGGMEGKGGQTDDWVGCRCGWGWLGEVVGN